MKTYWIDTTDTYKINADNEDQALELLSKYLDGDWSVPVKCKNSETNIMEDNS